MLVATNVEPTGLGGTINVHFQCNGCKIRSVAFQGFSLVEGSKKTVVGLVLGSFVIKNYMTGGPLWYGHKCMWKRNCMKELLNQWKVFCQMSTMSRQKLKAAVLKWCGRMGIPVLPAILSVTV